MKSKMIVLFVLSCVALLSLSTQGGVKTKAKVKKVKASEVSEKQSRNFGNPVIYGTRQHPGKRLSSADLRSEIELRREIERRARDFQLINEFPLGQLLTYDYVAYYTNDYHAVNLGGGAIFQIWNEINPKKRESLLQDWRIAADALSVKVSNKFHETQLTDEQGLSKAFSSFTNAYVLFVKDLDDIQTNSHSKCVGLLDIHYRFQEMISSGRNVLYYQKPPSNELKQNADTEEDGTFITFIVVGFCWLCLCGLFYVGKAYWDAFHKKSEKKE